VLAARLRPVPSTSNCERMFPVSAKAVVACFAAVKIEMKKLLLVSVLMLAFGSAHAFRNEYSNKPLLGEMNQEDYVCGSIQFSIRPKDRWVVWKHTNMPFKTSPIVTWAPQEIEWRLPSPHAPPIIERRFSEVWFGPKIHFVQRKFGPFLVKGANSWLCIREIDQKLDVTPGVTLDADGKARFDP